MKSNSLDSAANPAISAKNVKLSNYPWMVFFSVYLFCCGLFILWIMIGYMRIRQWTLASIPITDGRILKIFFDARSLLNIKRNYFILESGDVSTPISLGVIHPRILLPKGLAEELSDDDLLSIALHESAHIKQLDHLVLFVVNIIKTFLFFNPFIWSGIKNLVYESEKVADNAVIDSTKKPIPYAKLLTRIAEEAVSPPIVMQAASGIFQRKSDFLKRVETILCSRGNLKKLTAKAALIFVSMIIFSLVIACAVPVMRSSSDSNKESKQVNNSNQNNVSKNPQVTAQNNSTKQENANSLNVVSSKTDILSPNDVSTQNSASQQNTIISQAPANNQSGVFTEKDNLRPQNPFVSTLPVEPKQPGEIFRGKYRLNSGGRNPSESNMIITKDADNNMAFTMKDQNGSTKFTLSKDNLPVKYEIRGAGFTCDYVFFKNQLTREREISNKPKEKIEMKFTEGFLPDFNSRPDPYLIQNLLIRKYDFSKGGVQEFNVYDIDYLGTGLMEYKISLEFTDEDGVKLPNGKFKAKHIVQLQLNGRGTWFKKARESQTDFWVNDDLFILRVYRHREPFEVFILDYARNQDLISPQETAEEYSAPTKHVLTPLPEFDLNSIKGETVFQGVYKHRSYNSDLFTSRNSIKIESDGSKNYISEMKDNTYIATLNKEGKPVRYKIVSRENPEKIFMNTIEPGKVTSVFDKETSESYVSKNALPEFNSRPDPYCIQYSLLQNYDYSKKGKQEFTVYDWDVKTGKSLNEYRMAIDYVGDEELVIPAGKFQAKHLLFEQLNESGTWYKKWRGSKTDFWIDNKGIILKIYRYREPYEVILTEKQK